MGRSTKASSMRHHTLSVRSVDRLWDKRWSQGRLNPSSTKPANASSTKAAASSTKRRRRWRSFSGKAGATASMALPGSTAKAPCASSCMVADKCGPVARHAAIVLAAVHPQQYLGGN